VSFSIGRGEIVGLLGHNGAGKTTIMKMLTGFLEPSSGDISIDGHNPLDDPLAVRKKIGYLPENCPVYPEMSVVEYLDYAAGLHGVSEEQRPELLRQTLARTELTDKAYQPLSVLSRGYRQRVGVAQAIIHQPEILILDEPTNGLDPTQILHMRGLIKELAQRTTLIISTHILQEVQAVCSRVMIIRRGQKALDAQLDDLQKQSRLLVRTNAELQVVEEQLGGLAEITTVEQLAGEENTLSYGLSLADASAWQQAAAGVAERLHSSGCDLYELTREKRTLETVFGEITADERRLAS